MTTSTQGICCLCNKPYGGYGNNAQPMDDGECCDSCNKFKVIPTRLARLIETQKKHEIKMSE